jgi:integrase
LGERVTVAQFVDRWTTEPRYQRPAESTNVFNRERIRFLRQAYGRRRLSGLTEADARAFQEEHGPHAKKVAAAMFEDALREKADGLERNVFRLAGTQRKEEPPRIPTGEEVETLLQSAQEAISGDFGVYFASLVETAAFTGLMPGELLVLRWEDVDWEQGELHVRRAYRSKSKEVVEREARDPVLLPRATESLRRMQRLSPKPAEGQEGFVCLTLRGKRLADESLKYYWRPVREHAGLRWVGFKDLRHFFGRLLAQAGADPGDVAEQLGHRDGGRLAKRLYFQDVQRDPNERIRGFFTSGGAG